MKNYFPFIAILVSMTILFSVPAELAGQTVERAVVSCAGDHFTTSDRSITFSIGESFVQHHPRGIQLSEGFQQEWATVTAIDPVISDLGIKLYPSPTFGIVHVETAHAFLLELFDMSGQKLLAQEMYPGRSVLDIHHLQAGQYAAKIRVQDVSASMCVVKL